MLEDALHSTRRQSKPMGEKAGKKSETHLFPWLGVHKKQEANSHNIYTERESVQRPMQAPCFSFQSLLVLITRFSGPSSLGVFLLLQSQKGFLSPKGRDQWMEISNLDSLLRILSHCGSPHLLPPADRGNLTNVNRTRYLVYEYRRILLGIDSYIFAIIFPPFYLLQNSS